MMCANPEFGVPSWTSWSGCGAWASAGSDFRAMCIGPFYLYPSLMSARVLPPDIQAQLHRERQEAMQAATFFADICAQGKTDQLYDAHLRVNETVDGWRLAMLKVAKLKTVSKGI